MQAQELRFQTRRSPQTRQKRTYFLRQTFPFSAARKVLLQRLPASFFCKAYPHAENTRSTSRRSPQRSWERYRIVLRSTIWKRYCSQNENPRLFQTQKIQMQELHRPPSRKGYCVRNLPNFFRPFLISIGDIVSAPTSGSGRSAQTIILRNHSSEKRSPSPRIRYRFGKRERAFRRPNTSYGSRKRFL